MFQESASAKKFSDQAADVYENAITGVLGKNMLLFFAYADFEETRVKYEKVHTIYQRILDIEDIDPTLVRKQILVRTPPFSIRVIKFSIILIFNCWNWIIFLILSTDVTPYKKLITSAHASGFNYDCDLSLTDYRLLHQHQSHSVVFK